MKITASEAREFRLRRGFSQERMAAAFRVTRRTIIRWERDGPEEGPAQVLYELGVLGAWIP